MVCCGKERSRRVIRDGWICDTDRGHRCSPMQSGRAGAWAGAGDFASLLVFAPLSFPFLSVSFALYEGAYYCLPGISLSSLDVTWLHLLWFWCVSFHFISLYFISFERVFCFVVFMVCGPPLHVWLQIVQRFDFFLAEGYDVFQFFYAYLSACLLFLVLFDWMSSCCTFFFPSDILLRQYLVPALWPLLNLILWTWVNVRTATTTTWISIYRSDCKRCILWLLKIVGPDWFWKYQELSDSSMFYTFVRFKTKLPQ